MIYYGITDAGVVRTENQDTFACVELQLKCVDFPALLAAVCDGMGGEAAGDLASRIACDSFLKYVSRQISAFDEDLSNPANIPFEKLLGDGVKFANDEVISTASSDAKYNGMGTTLVGMLYVGDSIYAVNIGDSRMYALYGDRLEQITHDHSFVQSLVDSGAISREAAEHHPSKNIILRAIGASEEALPDVFVLGDIPDMLMLCSDGLSNMVSEDEMAQVLCSSESPEDAARQLVDMANRAGGTDNITVFAVSFR